MISTFYDSLANQIKSNQGFARNDDHKKHLDGINFAICASELKKCVEDSENSKERSEKIEVIKEVINDFRLPIQDLDSIYNKIHTKNSREVMSDPELTNRKGNNIVSYKTLVHVAYYLSEALVECVMRNDIKNTEILCEMGVKPICISKGYSALHIAAIRDTKILEKLLDYAPDYVNIQTTVHYKTPLQVAASSGKLSNILCIIQHNADPLIRDADGNIVKIRYDDTIISKQIYYEFAKVVNHDRLSSIIDGQPNEVLDLEFLTANTVKSLVPYSSLDTLPLPRSIISALQHDYYPDEGEVPVEHIGQITYCMLNLA